MRQTRRTTSAVAVRDAAVRPRGEPAGAGTSTIGFAGSLIRPDDQLRITFELVNGTVDAASNTIQPFLVEEPIYYVIAFGSQHTSEDTVSTADTPPDAPLAHRRAAASRVSVEIPAGTAFTVGTLLDLAAYALRVDPRGDGAPNDDPASLPAPDVTSLEIPASLILSPASSGPTAGRFTAEPAPITQGDVSEVWRARLVAADDAAVQPTLRAIARSHDDPPFPADDTHLDDLVAQTSGPDGVPMTVAELALSSQGATLDLGGAWATGALAAYHHRAITGRDIHIEVVTRGYLAPFGHPASLTTLTERQLRSDASGDLTATLTEDTYFAIADPVVAYPADDSILMPHQGRRLPFTSIAADDDGRGPVLQEHIVMPNGSRIKRVNACLLTRDGHDLVVSYTATDRNGNAVTFELPAVFVADSEAYEVLDRVDDRKTVLGKLATWYADAADDSRRVLQLGGQPVAWADPTPRGAAGSVQTTNRIRLALDRPALDGADPADASDTLRALGRPAFYPGVDAAWVVDQSSTTALGGDPPEAEVSVALRWLEHGLDPAENADLGYLDLVAPTIIVPATDALGMLAASLNVGTFGQFLGAGFKFPGTGGGAWEWNPLDALSDIGGALPKLLGSLELTDLIPPLDIAALDVPDGLPALRVEPQLDGGTPPIPTGACFHFTWEPKVRSFPTAAEQPTFVVTGDFADPLPEPGDVFEDSGDVGTRVLLALTACVPQATSTFEARLERFALLLPPGAPVIALCFQHVTYRNDNGTSTVDTEIADWQFIGALNWLEPLKDFLAGLLGNGAATFDAGIFVDYELPIPGFSIGVLGVSDLRVDLGVDLPDSGASSIDLAVGRRDDPFRLTILGFGGDGSFGLEVDARQIVLIEGSLAISFELAVDIFIAAASLSVSVGVFVVYEDGTVVLGAYADLRGSISALGLLEISGAVTVALTYNVGTKLLRGVAAVTGEVSSIFGKVEVTHDVEVELALGDGAAAARLGVIAARLPSGDAPADLSFGDRFTKPQWSTYCTAFTA